MASRRIGSGTPSATRSTRATSSPAGTFALANRFESGRSSAEVTEYRSPGVSPSGRISVPLAGSYATRAPLTSRGVATAGSSRPLSSATLICCRTVCTVLSRAAVAAGRIRPALRYVAPTRQVTPS
ncbi:hypothetical protein ONO86_04374 [Micromonospora noduli]|nr:hypothetical protein ONO86_04374 [Micromonospora noduli]